MIASKRSLKFLTLTWAPVKKQDPKIVHEMGKALLKLRHRKKYARAWTGILGVIECKKTESGMFYYHIHCIVNGKYIPQSEISKDWQEISRFPIVDIRRVWRTPKRALKYILKYVLKGFSFDHPKDVADFKASMKGVHYVRSYGDFYNFQYGSGKHVYFPCPACMSTRCWIVLDFMTEDYCWDDYH